MDTIVTPVTVITLDSTRIVHSIKADLVARYFPPVVRLVQYDMSLPVIAVSLMQNGQTYTLPSGAAANIRVHKPDATYVYNPALGCDSTRNIVYFEVTQAMAAANGDGLAIVEIVVNGDIAGTSLITLHFEENPVPEDAIESSDEWETIYELGERIIASTVTPVSTAAGMTDHNVVYLYTGTESGWNQGHLYYYNGTTWVDAGIAVTDKTLTVEGLAADAKTVGDRFATLDSDVANLKESDTTQNADISSLKEDLSYIKPAIPINVVDYATWSVGSIDPNGGGDLAATNRIRTGFIDISAVKEMSITFNENYLFITDWYDSEKNILTRLNNNGVWQTIPRTYNTFTNDQGTAHYVRILLRHTDNSNISANEGENVFVNCIVENAVNDIMKSSRIFKYGFIYSTGAIEVDLIAKTITFPSAYTRLITTYGENIDLTQLGTVQLPSNLFAQIYYNVDSGALEFYEYYAVKNSNLVFIGSCAGKTNFTLNAYPNYKINGVYTTANNPYWVKFAKYRYEPDYIAILGDSISTYSGYSEDAEESGTRAPYYPRGDVDSVEETWWAIVSKGLRNPLSNVTVSAVSRSAYIDQNDSTMPPAFDTARINRLGATHYPSYIFINVGTNDGYFGNLGDMTYETDIATLEALPNSTTRGIALTIRKIQNKYSNSRIVLLIPKPVRFASLSSPYTSEAVDKIAERIRALGNLYGVFKIIDLRKCDINQSNVASYCEDGAIHPNANGMKRMGEYILHELFV